VRQTRVLNSWT